MIDKILLIVILIILMYFYYNLNKENEHIKTQNKLYLSSLNDSRENRYISNCIIQTNISYNKTYYDINNYPHYDIKLNINIPSVEYDGKVIVKENNITWDSYSEDQSLDTYVAPGLFMGFVYLKPDGTTNLEISDMKYRKYSILLYEYLLNVSRNLSSSSEYENLKYIKKDIKDNMKEISVMLDELNTKLFFQKNDELCIMKFIIIDFAFLTTKNSKISITKLSENIEFFKNLSFFGSDILNEIINKDQTTFNNPYPFLYFNISGTVSGIPSTNFHTIQYGNALKINNIVNIYDVKISDHSDESYDYEFSKYKYINVPEDFE